MPIYRHECTKCGRRSLDILAISARVPPSPCCRVEQRRLMPTRVRGRVVDTTIAAEAEADFASEQRAELLLRAGDQPLEHREPTPWDVPAASWSGPPSSAAELDDRKRDTVEAMAAWQTRSLAADGVEYGAAKRQAEQHQQAVIATAE